MKLLVCVITGGRPRLEERVTAAHFPSMRDAGLTEIEWVVREDHAEGYEQDEHALNVYPLSFADEYAREHWRHPSAVYTPGGFHGAFPGREWAMRTAEARGYDAVLQLDDNVHRLGVLNANRPTYRSAMSAGRMLQLLSVFSESTNAVMVGAQLSSVPPSKLRTIRPGFPYSVFIERCGSGRMPYFGPFEDDIMHAMEYGLHGGAGRTAAVVEGMTYNKEYASQTGMRKHYDASRGAELVRRYPANATLRMSRRTSSVSDKSVGMRHVLNTRGFTPVRVTDPDAFLSAEAELRAAVLQGLQNYRQRARDKMRHRGGVTQQRR